MGGTIATIIINYLWRREKFPIWSNLTYGMLSGGALTAFCLLAPNYYFTIEQGLKHRTEILESGKRSTRRSSCKTPYAVVAFEEIEKEITFPCKYESSIGNYRKVELVVSRGLWGFYIINEKRLIQ
jgi:hypothetical protein